MHYPDAKEGTDRSEACTFDNVQPSSIKFRPSSAPAVKARATLRERESFASQGVYMRLLHRQDYRRPHSLRTMIRA